MAFPFRKESPAKTKKSAAKKAPAKATAKKAARPKKRAATRAAKPARKPAAAKKAGLAEYQRKRNFTRTAEPEGKVHAPAGFSYAIQKHDASHLHYDFRLELDGVLKSWAVPKGPSLDPAVKRLAIHVEDHPLEYGGFEGTIPQGEYGGGTVMLWDRGTWEPVGDPHADYAAGRLKFHLHGEKLRGGWMLVRRGGSKAGPEEKNWFLFKERDDEAQPGNETSVTEEQTLSVSTGRDLDEIAAGAKAPAKGKQPSSQSASPKKIAPKKSPRGSASKKPLAVRIVEPQLASLAKTAPEGNEWFHEIKFDGYRMICRLEKGKASFMSRNAQDWTGKFSALAKAVETLPLKSAIFDGEVVVLAPDGASSFQALQNVLHDDRSGELIYYVFDLLALNGRDLTQLTLEERQNLLAGCLHQTDRGPLRLVEHIEGHGQEFFNQACKLGLEGIISKRRDRPYRPGRSEEWLKTKCSLRDEFVICGFTDPSSSRTGLGALLVAYHDDGGALTYAGRVGTGFSEKTLVDLSQRLARLERKQSPLDKRPTSSLGRGVHWVKPELVAQVEFAQWTRDGLLRHPSFQGLREDKPAQDVVRDKAKDPAEIAAPPNGKRAAKQNGKSKKDKPRKNAEEKTNSHESKPAQPAKPASSVVAGVRISHPDRVLYPEQGIDKLQLATYYADVADWILPHVANRPLSLVRCPAGTAGECFYQKHAFSGLADTIGRVKVPEKNQTTEHLVVRDIAGIVTLVQFGVLEIHVWGSLADDIERPDRLIFDLDPDPSVAWPKVIEGARLMRQVLADLGLESFVKTTGGKGLHVVVPIRRTMQWDEAKAFCHALVNRVVADDPQSYLAKMSKAARKGKIFLDYLRNDRGATSIAAYSTRSRAGAPVSTPLAWEELSSNIKPDHFTVSNLLERLAALRSDPWEELPKTRQSITAPMKRAVGMKD